MEIEFSLFYPGHYQWSKTPTLYFIGYTFDKNGQLIQKADELEGTQIPSIIRELKGAFCIITFEKEIVRIYSDTIASFPIFYKIEGHKMHIRSEPQGKQTGWDLQAEYDFAHIFCTQFQDTLIQGWKSIPAGYYLEFNLKTGNYQLIRWFEHFSLNKVRATAQTEVDLMRITQNWAKQIRIFADGRPIWIPLSGGYDSRLLACILHQDKVPNLHAYTYGKSASAEVLNAHKTAKQLKLDWYFIPYTEQAFHYFFTEDWVRYALKNHHFQSLPHEQDFFALQALKIQGHLQGDFVVVPGFCGDIPTGSYLKNKEIIASEYLSNLYGVRPLNLVQDIESWDSVQQWLCENRLSKFIVNSVRVYEYFGGKWMLPMWHQDFLKLFYSLDKQDKWDQQFYLSTIFKRYFEPLEVDFQKPRGERAQSKTTWKDIVKEKLPNNLVKKIQDFTGKTSAADPCNLHTLSQMLFQHIQNQGITPPVSDKYFNPLHAFYMLEMLKDSLKEKS